MKYLNVILLCAAALLAGLVISVPLFISNVKPTSSFERPFITLDVPYAYLSIPSQNQTITGLNNNMINSILIANITNHSNQTIHINGIALYASRSLNVTNTKSEFSLTSTGSFLTQELAFNPYSADLRITLPYLGPHESKLIALSGTTDAGNLTSLQTGSFYLGGKLDGSIGDWHSTWGGAKQVQVQNLGNEYLYNTLLLSNQTLHLQGNYVYIQ